MSLSRTLAAVLLLIGLVACGGSEEPVARLGSEPVELELGHGRMQPLSLHWEPSAPLDGIEGEPLVFVHLLDDDGAVLLTRDHPLPEPWLPQRPVTDVVHLYHSALAPALPPGVYRLTAGIFDRGGRRWPLDTGEPETARHEYVVARVRIPEGGPGRPRYEFSDAWTPATPGGDRQVIALRWLVEPGSITVAELPGSGSLWLDLRIPEAGDGQQLLLDEGATAAAVKVVSSCGGFDAVVSGIGGHEIAVPLALEDQPAEGGCAIHLEPNFRLVDLETFQASGLALEQLAWRSDETSPSQP